jgi:hypothetical protein
MSSAMDVKSFLPICIDLIVPQFINQNRPQRRRKIIGAQLMLVPHFTQPFWRYMLCHAQRLKNQLGLRSRMAKHAFLNG